jgi:cytoskeleton protein RodZ
MAPLNIKPQEEDVTIEVMPESPASIEDKKQAALPDSEHVTSAVSEPEVAPKKALELSFQKDSWTEVRDATGETLIYRMVNEGEHLSLNGQAPYTILLGYAPGVTVTYKGDVFDTKPFQRDDIAYFRIGRKSPGVATEE